MPKSVILALSALGTLIVVGLIEKVEMNEPLKSFVPPFLDHLILTCQGLTVGGFLLWVFEESVAKTFGPIITDGFKRIGEALAGKMVGQGSISQELGDVLGVWAHRFAATDVDDLVKKGRIQEAVAKIETRDADEKTKREDEIVALLHSHHCRDWERALELTRQYQVTHRYFLTIAYHFWSSGETERAVEIAEEGFLCEQGRGEKADPFLILKFKNSLAYYYAEAEITDKAELALQYSKEAHEARANEAGPLDTYGYTLITFGKSAEEIWKGVDFCSKAREKGTPSETFFKHLERAKKNILALELKK